MKTKTNPSEFLCHKCGVPVGKLVPNGKDNVGNFFNVKHYENWSTLKNGKTICKNCAETRN